MRRGGGAAEHSPRDCDAWALSSPSPSPSPPSAAAPAPPPPWGTLMVGPCSPPPPPRTPLGPTTPRHASAGAAAAQSDPQCQASGANLLSGQAAEVPGPDLCLAMGGGGPSGATSGPGSAPTHPS